MRRLAAAITIAALGLGVATGAGAQTEPTQLRGISIGMTRGQISAALPPNYTLRANNLIVRASPEATCGVAYFDRRSVATEFVLFRCFFGADTMNWADFAQAIDNAYFAGTFEYAEAEGVRIDYPPAIDASVRMLFGPTGGGETIAVIEIVGANQPIPTGHEVYVELIPTPAAVEPAGRPAFD